MQGKRAMLARMMGATGATSALVRLRNAATRGVTILAYHRVLDVPDEDTFPFDIGLVSASTAEFEAQMEYVRDHFRPTTFARVLRDLDAGREPPRGSLIVTFDDGFDDNYHHAYPILRRFGVPATIFLATGYLDRQDLFWYDRLAYAVMTADEAALRSHGILDGEPRADALTRRAALRRQLDRLKQVPEETRLETLERVFSHLPGNARWRADGRSGVLTWDQVREMAANGIEFGSHTVTHPILSRIPDAQVTRELVESKSRIEAELGKPVEVIAYPVGRGDMFDDRVRAAVRQAGYKLGVSYNTGVEAPRDWDPLAVRRMHVERDIDRAHFRAMLAAPALFR